MFLTWLYFKLKTSPQLKDTGADEDSGMPVIEIFETGIEVERE
jgi:hypothetical protein